MLEQTLLNADKIIGLVISLILVMFFMLIVIKAMRYQVLPVAVLSTQTKRGPQFFDESKYPHFRGGIPTPKYVSLAVCCGKRMLGFKTGNMFGFPVWLNGDEAYCPQCGRTSTLMDLYPNFPIN